MDLAGFDLKYFGILYFVWLVASAITARYAHEIESYLGEFWTLMSIPIFLALNLLLMGKFMTMWVIMFIMFGEYTYGILSPVINDYINKHVESHHRATVLSLNGFFWNIVLIVMAPIFGYLADAFSFQFALWIEGFFVLIVGLPLVFLIFNSKKHIK